MNERLSPSMSEPGQRGERRSERCRYIKTRAISSRGGGEWQVVGVERTEGWGAPSVAN